jgi:hypothetical protein
MENRSGVVDHSDPCPYADHAAVNTMQQVVQRRHGPDPPKHLTLWGEISCTAW